MNPLKLLIVDDVYENRLAIKAALKKLNIKFFESENGKDAVKLAKEIIPDIVIMDIMMPVMDGFDAIASFREESELSTVPILAITALDGIDDKLKAFQAGATDFISKPFDKIELKARVESLHTFISKIKQKESLLEDLNKNLEKKVEEKTKKIFELYFTDTLTSLPNKLKLFEDLNKIEKNNFVLYNININAFNDLVTFFGYELTDNVLFKVASLLENFGDVYKLPSDSFVVLVKDVINENCNDRCLDIKKKIEIEEIDIGEDKIFINVSIGYCYGKEEAFQRSELALKFAKTLQRGYASYQETVEVEKKIQENLMWSQKLRKAFNEDRIQPFFQPILDIETNEIVRYEALVRLIDEDGSVVAPFFFLDVAKKIKLYHKLTKIMVQKSFHIFKDLNFGFSINLSQEDILSNTGAFILEQLDKFPNPHHICFEILESEGIDNYEEVSQFIAKVKRYGSKVCIDDFGSGYSNFAHLLMLNVDTVKIDGSLIKNIDTDYSAREIVRTIVEFTKRVGLKSTAEFVSSEAIFNIVKELGIDYAQGYYIGKPEAEL